MSKQPEKTTTAPAYGSFKTLTSFANDVRETGHVPLRVDRSLMPKLSGSAANETIATLRFLGLVTGEKAVPTDLFGKFVMAGDEDRKQVLGSIVREAYSFLFSNPDFDIERASGQQVAELFRAEGVNGSTLVRAVGFFLAAAKDAGIKVSPNVKAPPRVRNGSKVKKEKKVDTTVTADPPPELPSGDVHRFELPIPGKPSVVVLIPKSLDPDDWDMFKQMFTIYVSRWKGYKEVPPS